MGRIKIKGQKWQNITLCSLVHVAKHETLLYLGAPKDSADMIVVVGIGIPKHIEKGKEFDKVCMDFGKGYAKEIIVKSNHARRQIYTLKLGQYALFYGLAKPYTENKRKKVALYARMFQGMYVPMAADIKKIDPNDIEEMTIENESKLNFIDELLKGKNDD